MPVLNVSVRAFNACAESPRLHNRHFMAGTCLHVLFLPEQWKHCSEGTELFLFLLVTHAHATNFSFPRRKEKAFLYLITSSTCGWLIQEIRKDTLVSTVFLIFAFEASSGSNKAWPLGAAGSPYLVTANRLTVCSLWVVLNSCALWAHGASHMLCVQGRVDTPIAWMCSCLPCSALLTRMLLLSYCPMSPSDFTWKTQTRRQSYY